MELTQNVNRTPARPLLLIVALFCAIAIGLTGVLTLRSQSVPSHPGVTKPFAFDHEVPGPDSQSYKPVPVQPTDPADPIGK